MRVNYHFQDIEFNENLLILAKKFYDLHFQNFYQLIGENFEIECNEVTIDNIIHTCYNTATFSVNKQFTLNLSRIMKVVVISITQKNNLILDITIEIE